MAKSNSIRGIDPEGRRGIHRSLGERFPNETINAFANASTPFGHTGTG